MNSRETILFPGGVFFWREYPEPFPILTSKYRIFVKLLWQDLHKRTIPSIVRCWFLNFFCTWQLSTSCRRRYRSEQIDCIKHCSRTPAFTNDCWCYTHSLKTIWCLPKRFGFLVLRPTFLIPASTHVKTSSHTLF